MWIVFAPQMHICDMDDKKYYFPLFLWDFNNNICHLESLTVLNIRL